MASDPLASLQAALDLLSASRRAVDQLDGEFEPSEAPEELEAPEALEALEKVAEAGGPWNGSWPALDAAHLEFINAVY